MRRYVVFLSAVSGICGIGYELLLIRWFHTAVGHTVAVSAATVTTFLAGIALGALIAHKVAPKLGRVEAVGAFVAAAFAAFIAFAGVTGLTELVAPAGVPGAIAVSILGALPLAVLSGVAVPAYAARLSEASGADRSSAFAWVYVGYNALSAFGAILLETALVPEVGLAWAFGGLAAVNAALAMAASRIPVRQAAPEARPEPSPGASAGVILFAAGVGSGLAQIGVMKLGNLMFGYHAEHSAFAVAIALLGLSLGTFVAAKPRAGAWAVAATVVASVAAWSQSVGAWSLVAPGLRGADPALLVASKVALLAVVSLPFLVAIGAGVPLALARGAGSDRTPGRMVAAAASGNVVGALAAVLFAYAAFGVSGLIAAGVAAGALTLVLTRQRAPAVAVLLAAVAMPALQPDRLHFPANSYSYAEAGQDRPADKIEVARVWDKTVAAVTRDATTRIVIEGRTGALLGAKGIDRGEFLKGMIPASFARDTGSALVIGLGTSHTAAPVTATFDRSVVVDNSPVPRLIADMVAPEVLLPFEANDPEMVYRDAVAHLRDDERKYDAVVYTGAQATAPSVKLWSLDSVRAMAARMRDDGIFVSWVSGYAHPGDVLPASMSVLNRVFERCRMVKMSYDTYHALVCRKDSAPLRAKRVQVSESLKPALRKIGVSDEQASSLVPKLDRGPVSLFGKADPLRIDPPWAERVIARRNFFAAGTMSARVREWFEAAEAESVRECAGATLIDKNTACATSLFKERPAELCGQERKRLLSLRAEVALAEHRPALLSRAALHLVSAGEREKGYEMLDRAESVIPEFEAAPIKGLTRKLPESPIELERTLVNAGVPPWKRHVLESGAPPYPWVRLRCADSGPGG